MEHPTPVRISVFEFTKADFAALPASDRRLIILGGHALNLLGMWVKLLAATTNARVQDPVVDSFNAAQGQIVVRSLCGTLVETWNWVNTRDTARHIRSVYQGSLPQASAEAYLRLGKHFGSGLLAKARNTFAFHFPDAQALDEAFDATPDDHDFNWYMADENTNSLYFGCEAVIGHGLYNLASETVNGRSGLERLMHHLIAAANDMHEFLGGLLYCIVSRHLAECPRSTFDVEGAPGPRYPFPFLLDRIFG